MRIKKPTKQEWQEWMEQVEEVDPALKLALLRLLEESNPYLFNPDKPVRPRSLEIAEKKQ